MDAQLKNEIVETIKKIITVFTPEYTKQYLLALVRKIKADVNKEDSPYQLESRPPGKDPLKEGFLLKESTFFKKFNKRYVVFRPNYSVDIYDNEAHAHLADETKKRRASINLSGYWINDDPNNSALARLKRLAEKMAVDFANLPQPKQYPQFTIEVYHSRRPTYYFRAESQEQFDQWVAQFKTGCWKARGLSWDEECHQAAFPIALQKTRYALGRWGWWGGAGSEEQMLADLIADELEYDIISRVYSKLPGPMFIRNKLRGMVQTTIDTMILAAVKPAWAGMRKAVEELRPRVEPKIREATEPLFRAENEIVERMKDAVMSVIEPVLKERVVPHLAKIIAIIKSPMREAFAEAGTLLDHKITAWKHSEKPEDLEKTFRDLDYFARSWWELSAALNKVDVMYDPLWALRDIFPDIYPWSLIWKGHDKVYKHVDDAVYTWEQDLLKDRNHERAQHIKHEVLHKYRHDVDIATMKYYHNIISSVVLPPFGNAIQSVAAPIIGPLADAVPGPLQEFIDINQMFEDFYTGVVDDAIDVVLRADQPDEASGSV